jgi:hypothetical protein
MNKKIDMALFSVLRAYAARVYKSPKIKQTVESHQAVRVKAPFFDQNPAVPAEKVSQCNDEKTRSDEKMTGS